MSDYSALLSYIAAFVLGSILGGGVAAGYFRSKSPNNLDKPQDWRNWKAIFYIVISALASGFALSAMIYFGLFDFQPIRDFWISSSYLVVFILGSLFGLTELVSRYKDDPRRALSYWAAWFYVLINALASVFALNLIRVFGWFVAEGDTDLQLVFKRVLIAGFGSMILFRSSLFIIRTASGEIPFGPIVVLQILLGAADREVDRHRGWSRSGEVADIMRNVSFTKAKTALVIFCLELMQNVPKAEQDALGEKAKQIAAVTDLTERQKSILLGLALLNVVGRDLLRKAVESLGDEISMTDSA
ncbi:MAG: hypothetical protein ACR2MG_18840 [Pyrinomonadaceae bacterium]